MSLINMQTGKLRKWKEFGVFEKISLHSTEKIKEDSTLKLYNMLADWVKTLKDDQIVAALSLGPKKLYQMHYLKTTGWRRGYTK